MTPLRSNAIRSRSLAAACARHGLNSASIIRRHRNWQELNGAGNTWDFGPDDKKDYDRYLRGKAEPQVREILTNYGPVCLIWFDTPRMMTPERSQRFIDIVTSFQPATPIVLMGAWARRATIVPWATMRSPTRSSMRIGKCRLR